MRRFSRFPAVPLALLLCAAGSFAGAAQEARVLDPDGVQALSRAGAAVNVHPATGAARFVRLGASTEAALAGPGATAQARIEAFLAAHRAVFGLNDPGRELFLEGAKTDALGFTHITYRQRYDGVPVFAGVLKGHLDAANRLRVVNGTIIPDISLDARPSRTSEEAARVAVARVREGRDKAEAAAIRTQSSQLYVFREGLVQGIPGPNHLVWEVVVGNAGDVREFVYVDAHTNKIVEQYTGAHDAMNRRAFNGEASYPATPFWVEGDPFPTGTTEADNMIIASQETYNYYQRGFGRDAFNGAGATMDAIFNRVSACPNASWNGTYISFCPGLTTDDVTSHEWTHAYTEYTHGLIYAWQSGALNESYSDIFGEAVDLTNGRGNDSPGPLRTAGECSQYQSFPPIVRVTAPGNIAADYPSGTSAFSPLITLPGTTGDVVRPNDLEGASLTDGCCTVTSPGPTPPIGTCAVNSWAGAPAAYAGKLVLVDRGVCGFSIKAMNAQRNGAAGVIIGNVASSPTPTVAPNMALTAGTPDTITIPTTSLNLANADLIRTELGVPNTVTATLRPNIPGAPDNSYRWLVGEDVNATGLVGALRDMWTPTCFNDPGKVSDSVYKCGPITSDQGGVHSNSGVPNHAFALIVDGGTYNAQTIAGLGLVKASHLYFRAMAVYQVPTSDFTEHADALEASCSDLIGTNLIDPTTGTYSNQYITTADCAEVAKAMLAVQMRTPPTQCNFQPLLAKNPPALCSNGRVATDAFAATFESNPFPAWTATHQGVNPEFTVRDWTWANTLPGGRTGSGMFGTDPNIGTCAPGGDESGVLHLDSPAFAVAANAHLAFEHYVSTEAGWDGGNLKISVNGGPFVLVAGTDFTYNAYNATMNTVAQGNTSPLAGQQGFTGADAGTNSGSWGRSLVNLGPYAVAGDSVQLRWDIGSDGCSGVIGWLLDDVRAYSCVANSDVIFADGFDPQN